MSDDQSSKQQAPLPVHAPTHKRFFNSPGYLFWKIQSQLTKLSNRLLHQKLIKKINRLTQDR